MRICLLNDSFPPVIDGVANVVRNYAEYLTRDHGALVAVGTPRYPDADYDAYPYKVVPYQSFDTTALLSGYRTGNPSWRRSRRISSTRTARRPPRCWRGCCGSRPARR